MRLIRQEVQATDTLVARAAFAGTACIAKQAVSMLPFQSRHILSIR